MKKLLISILIIGALASFGADRQYAYKMLDGKLAKFKIITSDEASAYQAKGYTVESDKMKTCKIVGETVFLRFETVTSQERILHKFTDFCPNTYKECGGGSDNYTQDNKTLERLLSCGKIIAEIFKGSDCFLIKRTDMGRDRNFELLGNF